MLAGIVAYRLQSDAMKPKRMFRVAFFNSGKLYEIYATDIGQGEIHGFVEVSGIVFGEKSAVVVDPAEEKLKAEFGDVRRTFIPLHAVVRIDEVDKQGTARISVAADRDGKVTPFPGTAYPPRSPDPSRE